MRSRLPDSHKRGRNVRGNESKAEFRAAQLERVEAAELYLCDHPESSTSQPMTYSTSYHSLYELVQVNGWTCYEGGGDVSYPLQSGVYQERIVDYLEANGYE